MSAWWTVDAAGREKNAPGKVGTATRAPARHKRRGSLIGNQAMILAWRDPNRVRVEWKIREIEGVACRSFLGWRICSIRQP